MPSKLVCHSAGCGGWHKHAAERKWPHPAGEQALDALAVEVALETDDEPHTRLCQLILGQWHLVLRM